MMERAETRATLLGDGRRGHGARTLARAARALKASADERGESNAAATGAAKRVAATRRSAANQREGSADASLTGSARDPRSRKS